MLEAMVQVSSALRNSLALLLLAGTGLAHQPRFPEPGTTVVRHPEISQAFYAELTGSPQLYRIESPDSFRLYVQLLVPDIPGVTLDYSADIFTMAPAGREPVARLDGPAAEWSEFFEPFAGDNYFTGPEIERPAGPGDWFVEVTSPDNAGKYVLVVGQGESFPPGEIARTLGVLPKLKRDYFGKPAASAYWNYIGLFIGGSALVVAGIVVGIVLLARR